MRTCQEGFFHELTRASLWTFPVLGQRFNPVGVTAPCDYTDLPDTAASYAQCFITMTTATRTTNHRMMPQVICPRVR